MKKSHFGVMLFLTGTIGYLLLSLYLASNQYRYNGVEGTFGALLGNDLVIPYIIFCILGIGGLLICIYELYIKKS